MKVKLKPGIVVTPEIQEWLDKVSATLPSDQDALDCATDQAIFGSSIMRFDGEKLVRVPPEEWKK